MFPDNIPCDEHFVLDTEELALKENANFVET